MAIIAKSTNLNSHSKDSEDKIIIDVMAPGLAMRGMPIGLISEKTLENAKMKK